MMQRFFRHGGYLSPARIAVLAFVWIAVLVLLVPTAVAGTVPSRGASTRAGVSSSVPYRSTVDKFPLSFLEWLPAGFIPSHHYPLAVFFHGLGTSSVWVVGGVGGSSIPFTFVQNASSTGTILISLNTRSSGGFYANTACGGPQQQDVIDALNVETARRNISAVFFIGFSMGSLGALSIAGHFPGLVKGIALEATITDLFEVASYSSSTGGIPAPLLADTCGILPGAKNATQVRTYAYLSVARFDPTNYSGIRIYVSAGGRDTVAPNNFSRWPYAQANSTFVNSTCNVVKAWAEPRNCTTTFWSLAQNSSSYKFRFVYEPLGVHSALQLSAGDVFSFLYAFEGPGFFSSAFPGGGPLTRLPNPP